MWLRFGFVATVVCGIPAAWWYLRPDSGGRPELPVLERAGDFALVDQEQRVVRLTDFPDRAKILSFFYVRCNNARACPMTTRHFRRLQKVLGEELNRQTVLLMVTLDPQADTSGMLKKYGELYGADFRNWHFLTGTPEQIAAVCDQYQVIAERQPDGSLRHSVITFLIDRQDRLRRMYVANAWQPEELRDDLLAVLNTSSE